MSIDHGKLLAAYSEFFDAVMKDNATGESQRRRCAARDKVLELRALAQPAEAVAVFNCPTCPVSVESRWLEPRCPECDGPTELDSAAKPISDDAKRMLALESDPTFRAQYNDAGLEPVASRQIPQNTLASKATHRCDMCGNIDVPDPVVGCRRCGWDEMVLIESAQPRDDAAQVAVAPMLAIPEHIALYQGPDDCPHLQLNGTSVAIFPAGSWAAICDALDSITGSKATHPQAATAQGDGWRLCYSAVIHALAAIVNVRCPDKLFDLDAIPRGPVMDQVVLIREAMDRFGKELAAAPSQEPKTASESCVVLDGEEEENHHGN